MKLYRTDLTYQNFGSAWFIILRGATQDIEETFNACFNFGATNGQLEYGEHTKTVARFWSDAPSMRKFFATQYWLRHGLDANHPRSKSFVEQQMKELCAAGNHEVFLDFKNKFSPETFATGTKTAERPDADFKDAVLSNAFTDKEKTETVVEEAAEAA